MTTALDPVVAAEHWLAPVRLETTPVLFVVGFGEGHVLDALDRRGWTGQVIALEPDAATAGECLNRTAVRNWRAAGRLTVLAGPDYTGLDKAVSALPLTTEKPVIAGNPDVARLHREACVQAARMVSRAWFGARANDEARKQNAGRYLLNTLRNLRSIASEGDAARLVGAFAGVPALVVAAGPSLDRNLPDIVTLRDRALLIAVDTALRPLLAAGVQPDFVVAVDPSEANACHLTDLPPCPETHFVAEGSIDPEAVRQFEGRTFFFRVAGHHPWPWLRELDLDRQLLRAWGSVLTTAFDLALQMGCEPIVFAGADLAFTGGRPYARGTTYEEGWRREQAWGHTLEETWAKRLGEWPETFETGVDGGLLRTAPHLRSFRDWIVTEAGKSGRPVINATENGILVGGSIQQSTLVDVLSSRSSLPLTARQATAALHGARTAISLAPPSASLEVRREWMAFSGVSAQAIDDVFLPRVPLAVVAESAGVVASAAPLPEPLHPGLSDADNAYLIDLAQRETVRLVVLANPEQDLLADITRLAQDLAANDAIVIVDELGIAVGAQVRRAVDAVLCQRPDLWLEYRRFVDHASRLTVLRGGADRHVLPPADADRAKRDPAHQAVADSLVPLIVKQLAPASVVDVGCGAGFWLKAFSANGVSDVHGITPLTAVHGPGRRFDVCLCLEVAQHLSPDGQDALIDACTTLSDVIVFSSRTPGAPDGSRHDRPLPYWAAAFLRRGFILEDTLRPAIEQRWGFPRSVFDCLVAFRRVAAWDRESPENQALHEASLAAAQRIHDSYMQTIWWAVHAADRMPAAAPTPGPRSPMASWTIPPSRLLASGNGTRLFRFRTDAARWYLTHQARTITVHEDGRPMMAHDLVASVAAAEDGGWVLWRDEIMLKASDGTDPRTNGRHYSIGLPSHVAWAESQPHARSMHDGL